MISCEELKTAGVNDDVFEVLVTAYKSGEKILVGDDDLSWSPATDVYESEDAFVVQMDLSGMDPGAIEVLSDGDVLVVRGTRRTSLPPAKSTTSPWRSAWGPFMRRVPIPVPVDLGRAIARYRNGFLFVSLPTGKVRNNAGRRRIDVNGE